MATQAFLQKNQMDSTCRYTAARAVRHGEAVDVAPCPGGPYCPSPVSPSGLSRRSRQERARQRPHARRRMPASRAQAEPQEGKLKKPKNSKASEESRTRRTSEQTPNPFRERHWRRHVVDERGVVNCCIVLAEGTRSQRMCGAIEHLTNSQQQLHLSPPRPQFLERRALPAKSHRRLQGCRSCVAPRRRPKRWQSAR